VVTWIATGGSHPGEAATVVMLAATAAATVALASVPGAPPHASGQARTAVDGLIVAASALLFAWTLGLGELYGDSTSSHRALTLILAVANIALASSAIVMLTRARPAARPQLLLVAGGLSAIALATAAMAYLTLGGGFGPAAVLYLGLPAG
jgi:hypothetical protein